MAFPNNRLIHALHTAARNLEQGAYYAWGHHGACNCGHLMQVVTQFTKEDILQFAHTATGEWTEIAEDYCDVSGTPATMMISKLRSLGLTNTDIHNLEYLEDREVLAGLPGGFRWLKKNKREDVIPYFESFANILEKKLEEKNQRRNAEPASHKRNLSEKSFELAG